MGLVEDGAGVGGEEEGQEDGTCLYVILAH